MTLLRAERKNGVDTDSFIGTDGVTVRPIKNRTDAAGQCATTANLPPRHSCRHRHLESEKPKFHYADFPVTSATSPRLIPDVPFSPISLRRLPRNFPGRGSFGEVGVMEFG